ncbi:FAD-dependent oxidoreductase [Candidatus Kaiserbacteria bacterium]|nr:FAD-dependent oxidoreductase [Candidatus Kaiserbacteria bacterium]
MIPLIENSCYWLATREKIPVCKSLKGDKKVDIAIIGGGFTGLWTALFLKQLNPSITIALVEQKIIAYGASGRNGGQVLSNIGHHLYSIKHFGIDEARELEHLGHQNFQEFEAFASDCDFEHSGQLNPALNESHMEIYQEMIDISKRIGSEKYRVLSSEEIRNEVNSPLYIGGVSTHAGGIVNPVKVAQKLKRTILEAGVEIYENTSVIHRPKKGLLQTTEGSLQAKRVILATDAFGHHLFPELLWKYIPVYDYISVSEPLSSSQLGKIGWRHRQAVFDVRSFFNYYRLTHDNRILWGSSEAKYYSPNQVDASHDFSKSYQVSLLESFRKHFPYLTDLSFPYVWGGPIASTTRLSACFGSIDKGNVVYALGYTGEGVACSRFAAKILAHMALEKKSPLLDLQFVKKSPIPPPPEPLRKIAVAMVTQELRKTDVGSKPGILLRALEKAGIGFSS